MNEREQTLLDLCRRLQRDNRELRQANQNLAVERDAADVLLGAAMDQVLADNGGPRRQP